MPSSIACTRKREKNSPCQRKADDARENSFSETRKKNPRNDPLQKAENTRGISVQNSMTDEPVRVARWRDGNWIEG